MTESFPEIYYDIKKSLLNGYEEVCINENTPHKLFEIRSNDGKVVLKEVIASYTNDYEQQAWYDAVDTYFNDKFVERAGGEPDWEFCAQDIADYMLNVVK